MNKSSVKRLIRQFVPEHYDLHITSDSEQMTFQGTVKIHGVLPDSTKVIKLHSDGLTIEQALICGLTITELQPKYSKTDQELHLISKQSLEGSVVIEIKFSGIITKPMHGLYPCFFTHNSIEKMLLATQFESHHAREVFPCVDEPEAKATFKLTLITPKHDTVLSNTPVEIETAAPSNIPITELKSTTFATTPRMSTYLLAWVHGDLTYEEMVTKHGVTVRAYSTPVHTGKTHFGLQIACDALDFMDDYFNIPYPLPKCDIIALPDFAAGAMENWGCVTFRESAMLIDENLSDLSDKQHVAEVVVHELAHQWFGNLVTMRWWEDLWLNEGFASWVPYLVLDSLRPEWNMWEQFSRADLMIGMKADALEYTHPIVVSINNPGEIRSAFDSISYDKGCAVIHLLHEYIGAVAFKTGIRAYLKEHAYSNASTHELWEAFTLASGQDVATFMRTWTQKSGFPVVHVDSNDTMSTLTQERFFVNPAHPQDSTIWPIPLMRTERPELFDKKTATFDGIHKLNGGQRGFYRTTYSGPIFTKLQNQLNTGTLSPSDSVGLITDTAESAKAGHAATTDTLQLIWQCKMSQSESVMSVALTELGALKSVLHASYEPLRSFTLDLILPNLKRLGYEQKQGESVDDELLRPSILAAASYGEHKPTSSWAVGLFDAANSPEDIRADIRGIAYAAAVREYNNAATYDKLLSWYVNNTIPGERASLAGALTGFKAPELIQRSLSYITSDTVKLQDAFYWVAYSLAGRYSKQSAWEWLQQNWGWVGSNFGKENEVNYYLRYAANGFATEQHLEKYQAFFSSVDIYSGERSFRQGIETIQWQSAWKERDEEKIVNWLTDTSKS